MKVHIHKMLMPGLIVIALLMLGAMYIWAPVCDGLLELANGNMVHMKCFYARQAVTVVVLLLLVQAASAYITKKTNPVMIVALGIMLVALTYQSFLGIGICMNDTMPCHDTASWIRGGGTLTILIGIAACFTKPNRAFSQNNEEKGE